MIRRPRVETGGSPVPPQTESVSLARSEGARVTEFNHEPTINIRRAKPFLKWAGGKRQLLPELRSVIFGELGWDGHHYHEPFLGGGALFFDLAPATAILSDVNERLVWSYRGVRDQVENVIEQLLKMPNDPAFFKEIRSIAPCSDGARESAWMIYLNRTCFNGLYRVNRKDQFNVPFGRYKNPAICNAENLRACSMALRSTSIHCGDFTTVVEPEPGDLVYFDPPYAPLSKTSDFTSYSQSGFRAADHERLRNHALSLKQRGVKVLLSNSSADLVRELYAGWNVREVDARRNVNSVGTGRGKIKELLIW